MLLQGEAFIQEVLAAVGQVPVEVLNLEALVILQKVQVQNHITVALAQKTIVQVAVADQQKEVIFQYLSPYHSGTEAMEEVIIMVVE